MTDERLKQIMTELEGSALPFDVHPLIRELIEGVKFLNSENRRLREDIREHEHPGPHACNEEYSV